MQESIKNLQKDIEICEIIIKFAGSPELIQKFTEKRDEAKQKIKEILE